jgi:hypothetical protein
MNSLFNNRRETRFFAKITLGSQQALSETVYYRNDMLPDFFFRWLWYFKYRQALFQVKNPKWYCELSTGGYQIDLSVNEYKIKVKNKITAKKRKITELDRKITHARKNWDELWPIEEHPLWVKVKEKVARLKKELKDLESEYKNIE